MPLWRWNWNFCCIFCVSNFCFVRLLASKELVFNFIGFQTLCMDLSYESDDYENSLVWSANDEKDSSYCIFRGSNVISSPDTNEEEVINNDFLYPRLSLCFSSGRSFLCTDNLYVEHVSDLGSRASQKVLQREKWALWGKRRWHNFKWKPIPFARFFARFHLFCSINDINLRRATIKFLDLFNIRLW